MANAEADDPLTYRIIGRALKVRGALGCGVLESAYQACLCYELTKAGFGVERQVVLPLVYDGIRIDMGYRPDIIVDREVIVEVKAVSALNAVHEAQLLTYLRLTGIRRGLLINFHAVPFTKGIKRLVF